jgi:hypothetical protein
MLKNITFIGKMWWTKYIFTFRRRTTSDGLDGIQVYIKMVVEAQTMVDETKNR